MQLYVVAFKNETENLIDVGKCIVTGETPDDAISKVCYHSKLLIGSTSFKVEKIKPQLFSLDRARIKKRKPMEDAISKDTPAVEAPSHSSICSAVYTISIDGEVWAQDEQKAVKAVAHHAIDKVSGRDVVMSKVMEFDIKCEKTASPSRGLTKPYIEKQAIYKETRVFQGGSCSPR